MRQIISESLRGRHYFKFASAIIVTLVIVLQIFVVYKVQAKFKGDSPESKKSSPDDEVIKTAEKKSILDVINNLPKPELDELEFKAEVVRPHREMVEKFPRHPDSILKKLLKTIDKEKQNNKNLIEEIDKVRIAVGITSKEDIDDNSIDVEKVSLGRKLKSLKYFQDSGKKKSILDVINNLPEPQLDELEFKAEVVRPHREMVEKFPRHPDSILKKLLKFIDKEKQNNKNLVEDIDKVRLSVGITSKENAVDNSIDGEKVSVGRKLKSLKYFQPLETCPIKSPLLLGPLLVQQDNIEDLEPNTTPFKDRFGEVKEGGQFKPEDCTARQKVAIIIPYRDRQRHLKLFLYHMHPVLQRQQLDYRVFIVEQAGRDEFNRAALMNVGYKEASKLAAFTCFVFHDVDLVPEDDRNLYTCPDSGPKHLAVAVNKWKYKLIYENYFGGVTALNKEQFEAINGFANSFYGWGGEDDDLHHRVDQKGYKIFRYPGNIGRYSMLKHDNVKMNEELSDMMGKSEKNLLKEDGLSTLEYKVLNSRNYPLYTWILAKLPPPPKKKEKDFLSKAKGALWNGMNNFAGGFAAKIAKTAQQIAVNNDEREQMKVNHVY